MDPPLAGLAAVSSASETWSRSARKSLLRIAWIVNRVILKNSSRIGRVKGLGAAATRCGVFCAERCASVRRHIAPLGYETQKSPFNCCGPYSEFHAS